MDQHLANSEKVAFFRSMFVGRKNAFARRFESAKTGKNGMKVVRLLLEDVCENLDYVLKQINILV